MNAWVAVASSIGGIITALGGAEIIKAWLARRRPSNAENVRTLNETTLAWAEELKQDAGDARRELAAVRQQTGQVFAELAEVRTQLYGVEQLVARILHLVHHTPDMTLERLRTLVPEAPPREGGT